MEPENGPPLTTKMSLGYHCFQVSCYFSGVQNERHLGTADAYRYRWRQRRRGWLTSKSCMDFTHTESLYHIHPGRLTWNLQITHLERKMIFQTSMIMFHVNLQGCITWSSNPENRNCVEKKISAPWRIRILMGQICGTEVIPKSEVLCRRRMHGNSRSIESSES